MVGNFKNIHIGNLIEQRMIECEIDTKRASIFLDVGESEIQEMYTKKSFDTEILLRWSKLLKYDFFRIYSQHLILYAPPHPLKTENKEKSIEASVLPVFRKNIYTQELIQYLIEQVEGGGKTTKQIQEEYNIPATTILRWIHKHKT